MLESILKFNKSNFYQAKVNAIGEVVRNYAQCKLTHRDKEKISLVKDQAQQTISSIVSECGFTDRDNSYVAIDKEFFTDKDQLDEERLKAFQGEVVKNYGLQQLKWSFAGTTLQYTQLTKRELKKQGIIYEELLPYEMQKIKEKEKQQAYHGEEPNTYRAFLYSDGSVSEAIIPERMQIRLDNLFDNLKDQSGFDWESGYSPDNEVVKKDWITGFNEQGIWEKVLTVPGAKVYQPYHYSLRLIDFFTGTESESIPGNKGDSREHSTIGIIQGDDGTFLIDDYSFLYEDYEEFYYSITGEVYGARKVDKKKSLQFLKESLDEKGVDVVTTVVLRQASKDAVQFYKTILADYITEKTRFYSRNDKNLIKKLSDLRTTIEGKEVSNRVIADLYSLSKRGIKQEELEKNLDNKRNSRMWEVPLHIFEQESDLETFLLLPRVQELCEEETAEYLKSMKVPGEKRTVLSNAVQNLIFNYKEIFKHNPVKQIDVIRAAEEYLVKNRISPVCKTKVTAEESLYTVIKKAANLPGGWKEESVPGGWKEESVAGEKEHYSAFIPAKEKSEYKDLFDDQELSAWIREELEPVFPENITMTVKKECKTIIVPEAVQNKFSIAVQNIFPLFTTIAESTGITPLEIITHIKSVLLDEAGTETLKRKRIFFEKSVKDIIIESSKTHTPVVMVEKKDVFHGEAVRIEWKPFSDDINLFQDNDLDAFLTSPVIVESGFQPEETIEIMEYIRSMAVAGNIITETEKNQLTFSRQLINIIRGYEFRLKPFNISFKDACTALTDSILIQEGQKDRPDIDLLTHERVMKVARTGTIDEIKLKRNEIKIMESGETLPLLIEYGIDSFLSSGLITEAGIPREDAVHIYNYLKDFSFPENLKKPFLQAVERSLRNYRKTFAEDDVSALDAVKAISLYMSGKADTLSPKMQQSLHDVFSGIPGIPETDTLDLLKQDDFNKFIQSDIFKTSGLKPDQFRSIIRKYRSDYNQNNEVLRFFHNIPVTYSDDVAESPPLLKGNIPPGYGMKNNLFTVGFVLKAYPGHLPVLFLTKQGKKALSQYTTRGGEENVISGNENNTMQLQEQDTHQDNEWDSDFPYIFTQSYSQKHHRQTPSHHTGSQKKTFQSSLHKNILTSQQQKFKTVTGEIPERTKTNKGLTRFQRIENNYYNDKQMLARSSSFRGVPGMASEEKKKKSKDEDNVIKQLSDDLLEEMKNKAKEEGF